MDNQSTSITVGFLKCLAVICVIAGVMAGVNAGNESYEFNVGAFMLWTLGGITGCALILGFAKIVNAADIYIAEHRANNKSSKEKENLVEIEIEANLRKEKSEGKED